MSKKTKTEKISFWANNKRFFYYSAGLLVLAFLAQFYSIWGGFTMGDYFSVQPLFGIEPKKWGQYFMEVFANGVMSPFSAPLTKASLALDFQSGRWGPAAYHATNLVLHIFGTLSSFLLLSRINDLVSTDDRGMDEQKRSQGLLVALLAVSIFAVHPALSDTVASLGGRGALISFLLYMLGLYFFTIGLTAAAVWQAMLGYFVAYLCVLTGIFAYSQVISLPLMMVWVGCLIKPTGDSWRDWLYSRSWELGTALALAIGLPFLLLKPVVWPAGNALGQIALTHTAYLATQLKSLPLFYLRNYFVPVGLTIDPRYTQAMSFADPLVWLGAFILVGFVALLFILRRRPLAFFGCLLFIVGFFPLALLPQVEYVSGARFYLSALGLSVLIAQLLAPVILTGSVSVRQMGRPKLIALALVALSLIGLCAWRDRAYTTNSALLRGALRLDPDNARLRAIFAMLLTTDAPEFRRAAELEAVKAFKAQRDLPCAYFARGIWAHQGRDYSTSRFCFEEALKLAQEQKLTDEIILTIKYGLAINFADANDFSDAAKVIDLARSALTLYPARPRLYLALGKALMAEGKPESAEAACREFDKGRRFDRNDADFAIPNARAALRTGYPIRFEQAYGAAKTINRITRSSDTVLLLARSSLETGRIWRGIAVMQEYFTSTPRPTAEAYLVTSALARQIGDQASAKLYLEKARTVDPQIEKKERLFLTVKPKPKTDELKDEDAYVKGNSIVEVTAPIHRLIELEEKYQLEQREKVKKAGQQKELETGSTAASKTVAP